LIVSVLSAARAAGGTKSAAASARAVGILMGRS
jgi:hypothetical protein